MTRHLTLTFALILGFLTSSPAFAQHSARHQTRPISPKTAVSSGTAASKGILEPVNYGQDIKLTDVFFTGIDEGWVAGEHGTILHTNNGGANWTAQVGGDPNNSEQAIGHLYFLDRSHGWA